MRLCDLRRSAHDSYAKLGLILRMKTSPRELTQQHGKLPVAYRQVPQRRARCCSRKWPRTGRPIAALEQTPRCARRQVFKLLNREISFDVDLTRLPCGMGSALFLVEMPPDGFQGRDNKALTAWGSSLWGGTAVWRLLSVACVHVGGQLHGLEAGRGVSNKPLCHGRLLIRRSWILWSGRS